MKKRAGFTLVECIIALMLFAIVAVMVGQSAFNTLNAVKILKKDAFSDAFRDYLRVKVLSTSSLTEIQEGITFDDFEGQNVEITGDAEATMILDLFKLVVETKDGKYKETFYLNRPSWYDELRITVDREQMLSDREEHITESRRALE